jgi:hypothetical protein
MPADIFHSQLADLPADRFRIGVGRRDPGPALEVFDEFLRSAMNLIDAKEVVFVQPPAPALLSV